MCVNVYAFKRKLTPQTKNSVNTSYLCGRALSVVVSSSTKFPSDGHSEASSNSIGSTPPCGGVTLATIAGWIDDDDDDDVESLLLERDVVGCRGVGVGVDVGGESRR